MSLTRRWYEYALIEADAPRLRTFVDPLIVYATVVVVFGTVGHDGTSYP